MPKKRAEGGRDAAISRIAAREHGVVTTEQLLSAGVLPSGLTDGVKAGRLHRIHRGVYALGHPNIGNQGRWMAAVLAIGAPAVLQPR
jgi:predicted transcriptional regulator of viral defense system